MRLAVLAGFEPATPNLEGSYSIQLSYSTPVFSWDYTGIAVNFLSFCNRFKPIKRPIILAFETLQRNCLEGHIRHFLQVFLSRRYRKLIHASRIVRLLRIVPHSPTQNQAIPYCLGLSWDYELSPGVWPERFFHSKFLRYFFKKEAVSTTALIDSREQSSTPSVAHITHKRNIDNSSRGINAREVVTSTI